MMSMAEKAALLSAGLFLLIGLFTGIWKYLQIRRSEKARAHYYVDVAHRASLMYAFACVVLERLAAESAWSDTVNLLAVLAAVLFFALAVASYVVHGLLADTTNQLRRPHRLGKGELPAFMITGFMWLLILAEVGGVAVLFAGVLEAWYGVFSPFMP